MVVNRIGPFSLAKLAAALYAILGLIFGALFTLFGMAGFMASGGEGGGMMGAIFGIGAIVILPIVYGCLGFIGSLLMAFLYNVIAGMVGGVELDVT
jgi:hypothetical protein